MPKDLSLSAKLLLLLIAAALAFTTTTLISSLQFPSQNIMSSFTDQQPALEAINRLYQLLDSPSKVSLKTERFSGVKITPANHLVLYWKGPFPRTTSARLALGDPELEELVSKSPVPIQVVESVYSEATLLAATESLSNEFERMGPELSATGFVLHTITPENDGSGVTVGCACERDPSKPPADPGFVNPRLPEGFHLPDVIVRFEKTDQPVLLGGP
ncbi:hypothetical protein BJ742DRAFT_812533 [Cladochytrium replicatum]|nr:hypothetical protein BJ742DRAFT_812533 [Cladochytrium replicatum]